MTFLWWLLGIVGYLTFGYLYGRFVWIAKTIYDRNKNNSILFFLVSPIETTETYPHIWTFDFIYDLAGGEKNAYAGIMAFVWPIRLLLNLIGLGLMVFIFVIGLPLVLVWLLGSLLGRVVSKFS